MRNLKLAQKAHNIRQFKVRSTKENSISRPYEDYTYLKLFFRITTGQFVPEIF